MNRPVAPSAGPLTLAALIFIAALSRVLPHPPNFSPIEAVALFGGGHVGQALARVLARNPELLRSQAEVRRAERQLELERLRRQPELALKVANERDRELNAAQGKQ